MYLVIYQFIIKKDSEEAFINAWKEMTDLIYQNEGSLGSKLTKEAQNTYIAIAQWPDQNTFDNAGDNLPAIAEDIRKRMREACEEISVLKKLDLVSDLSSTSVFNHDK